MRRSDDGNLAPDPEAHEAAGARAPVIQIRGLCKSFGSNHVLQGFDLDVYRGENVMVLGKSGSGKSVLIKCIVRLLEPDAGEDRLPVPEQCPV